MKVAVEGMAFLSHYYKLSVNHLANGLIEYNMNSFNEVILNVIKTNSTLNTFDCYRIGKIRFLNEDYKEAKEWFKEAINRIDNKTTDQMKADVYEILSLTEYELKNFGQAMNYMT